MATSVIVSDNIELLLQVRNLVVSISREQYVFKPAIFKTDCVGAHLRHVLDHYFSLIRDLSSGRIDYDRRERDPRIAEDPAVAAAKMDEIIIALGSLPADDTAVAIKMDCGDCSVWSGSTLGRELQFQLSHHVHHNAIIRMILEAQSVAFDESFGLAPSTIKYRIRSTVGS